MKFHSFKYLSRAYIICQAVFWGNGDIALNKRNLCPEELPFHWRGADSKQDEYVNEGMCQMEKQSYGEKKAGKVDSRGFMGRRLVCKCQCDSIHQQIIKRKLNKAVPILLTYVSLPFFPILEQQSQAFCF